MNSWTLNLGSVAIFFVSFNVIDHVLMQTEQMGRIVNELDTIQFSIKKASQLVKEIGRQVRLSFLHI